MGFIKYLIDHFFAAALLVIGSLLILPVFLTWLVGGKIDWVGIILLFGAVICFAGAQWTMRKWHFNARF